MILVQDTKGNKTREGVRTGGARRDSNHTPSSAAFYYESMNRKLEPRKPIYECRCNGRLQTKRFTRLARLKGRVEESTCLTCTGLHGKTN